MTRTHADGVLDQYASEIDVALRTMLAGRRGPTRKMYLMLEYFLGFRTEELQKTVLPAGKRFRSALTLAIADMYGQKRQALDASLAVELFHNFTLIHDDVEDRDEIRRGRPTVWKLWGVNNAINAGDALLLIVNELCAKISNDTGNATVVCALHAAFRKTIEGQFLDFEFTDLELGAQTSMDRYFEMTRYKTGALVGAASQVAGLICNRSKAECALLNNYGLTLGTTYQLVDDYRAYWATSTGKDAYGDIRERKKTFPALIAYRETPHAKRLAELYNYPRQLTRPEIHEVLAIIHKTAARKKMLSLIHSRAQALRRTVKKLPVDASARGTLIQIVETLMPETLLK